MNKFLGETMELFMNDLVKQMKNKSNTQAITNKTQTIMNVRKDIIGALDAINQYSMHIVQSDSEMAKSIWQNIRDEEEIHVGELFNLLFKLDPLSYEQFKKGFKESEPSLNN